MIKNKYLIEWIKETYPTMYEDGDDGLCELDYFDMDKFAEWLVKKLTILARNFKITDDNSDLANVSGSAVIDQTKTQLAVRYRLTKFEEPITIIIEIPKETVRDADVFEDYAHDKIEELTGKTPRWVRILGYIVGIEPLFNDN